MNKPVFLEKHNPKWKEVFRNEAELIGSALKGHYEIDHIGSTVIEGMLTKPCVDILISISDFRQAMQVVQELESIQYELHEGAGEKGRRMFLAKGDYPNKFHIHLVELKSESAWKLLAFRDYISNNELARKEYIDLKLKLQKAYPLERPKYTLAKTEFVENILKAAKKEY